MRHQLYACWLFLRFAPDLWWMRREHITDAPMGWRMAVFVNWISAWHCAAIRLRKEFPR